MSRVILVGEGPLPGADSTGTSFAQLRLHQLREALREEHEVTVVDARDPFAPVPGELVVTAGTYLPTKMGLAIAEDRPLCVDLPGDPFADAQQVARWGDEEAVANDARAVFVPALARADAFTTISGPSRYALLGQLGVLGRLVRTPPGHEWAHVTPVAWAFPGVQEGARRPADAPLRVALVGGFNTWFDAELLLDGLLLAMEIRPFDVECVGGAIPGHHTASFTVFAARARASRHAARFHFHDRLPPPALAELLARCTVLPSVDRPGHEPELGSRTRLLFALHQGLRPVGTVRCELARTLVDGGWMTPSDADPVALAHALLAPAAVPDRAPLRERFSVAATTAGLRTWVRHAARSPVHAEADALLALAKERDDLRASLQAIWRSPTWRALDRVRRITRR